MPSWLPSPLRVLKVTAVVFGALVLAGAAFFFVLYSKLHLPSASAAAVAQRSTLHYTDGSVLAHVGTVDRQDVSLGRVPLALQHSVLAAEDNSFYSEPAIDPLRTFKAAVTDVLGGSLQGASTLSQQYVKTAYLSEPRTLWRKVQEAVLATKLTMQTPRQQIFTDYLNTVYFGRGAYGVAAAAEAYFGVPLSRLNTAQAALLAGVVNAPSYLDPAVHPQAARGRWDYVVGRLVADHYLSEDAATRLRFPATVRPRPAAATATPSGPQGYLVQAVLAELARHGITQQMVDTGGLQVTTTIDPRMEQDAIAAEQHALPAGPPTDPLSGLVAEVPGDGAVRALYGGRDYGGHYPAADVNAATGVLRQAGSSFKPYVLAAALEQGMSLNDVVDGSSPKTVPGYPHPVTNYANEQCVPCTLLDATAKSINTVYVPLAIKVGPQAVANVAHAAGIPGSVSLHGSHGYPDAGIALGIYGVHVIDQATGFATFASGGVAASPYLVTKVTDAAGNVVYHHRSNAHRVMAPHIAAGVTYALQQVVHSGTGTAAQLPGGRPAAGKTGTAENESDAWFVGYTPGLATAVWEGYPSPSHTLHNVEGVSTVVGGTLPAQTWRTFMATALAGTPVQQFPAYTPGPGKALTGPGLTPPPPPPPAAPQPAPSAPAPPTKHHGHKPQPTASAPTPSPTQSPAPTPSAAASSPPATPATKSGGG